MIRTAICVLALAAAILPPAGAGDGSAAASPGDPNAPDPNAPIHAGQENVVVTGEGSVATDAPTTFATVLRSEEFGSRFTTLADLLDETVGVRVRSYGGVNSFATVSIRGSTADQVTIFLDGVPLNSPLGGGVNLADIPLAGVKSIEVYRGFAPSSLGAASIGGAINVRTRAGGDEPAASGAVAYGSFTTGSITGLGDWQEGGWRWAASGESIGTEGDFLFLDDNGTSFTTSDDRMRLRANNQSWSAALRVRGTTTLASGREIDLSAEWSRRRQGVPGIDAFQSLSATFALQRGLLRGQTAWRGLAAGRVDVEAGGDATYDSESFDDSRQRTSPTPADVVTRVSGIGARTRILIRASEAHRLSILVEPRRESAGVVDHLHPSSDDLASGRTTLALVAEDEWRAARGRLLVSPSLRGERIEDTTRGGPPSAGAAPTGLTSSVTGRLGALYALSSRWSLRGNVGRYFRVPSLLERFGDDGAIAGNPALRPEEGVNADAGVAFDGGAAGPADRISSELVLFRTDASDLIQLVPISASVVKPQNVSRARITGAEASLSMRLWRILTLSGNATLQRPILLGDTFARGSDLPFRPRFAADTQESLGLGRLSLFHRFSYVGANDMTFAGRLAPAQAALTRLPARYLHDAGATVRLGARAEATIEIDNIFDRHVVDVARYPLPGRFIVARLSARM